MKQLVAKINTLKTTGKLRAINEEYTDMILVYGFCEGNGRLSVRVYGERFPNRRLPNHTTFTAVVRRLRETGRFAARTADYGRNRFVRTADVEEEILARVEADPELRTRRIGAEMEISKDVVHRTLKEHRKAVYSVSSRFELLMGALQGIVYYSLQLLQESFYSVVGVRIR
ncbi:hypothetical protein NQ318_000450 [Aromia moschata]|uniref:DUF4817 domain-containing protein n=1 Tax=Aromia moschata TaxID=1265417 RepID=A0AAV8YU32_9CUCU|nr:hypothetical protein NQ318_000450 [Aromia moschata]